MIGSMDLRPEYPRPQWVRPEWQSLNGWWQFEIDQGDSGVDRGLHERPLQGRILLPFCPESRLSGIGRTDFLNAVWYRRTIDLPQKWTGKRVLLHFQAIDDDATIWVDGREVARHRGGSTPVTCDLGLCGGHQQRTIVVRARDNHRHLKPRGKQSHDYTNARCHYTRTTGIWQTVWLEAVAARAHLQRPKILPDLPAGAFWIEQPVRGDRAGLRVRVTLKDAAGEVARAEAAADGMTTGAMLRLDVPEGRRRAWSPQDPHLYDLTVQLIAADGTTIDQAESYAGLRSISIDRKLVLLNGRPLFQRLVLDQGYYADGLLTAPSDAALELDIRLSMAAGFNGARLHQKVFEERFLYHADRLGYLVWGEFGDWGCREFTHDGLNQAPGATYITQWLEILRRDVNHPSIVGWCPLNETIEAMRDRIDLLDDITWGMYLATRQYDMTRPVLDASGYSHRVAEADIYDSHDYGQDVEAFRQRHAGLAVGRPFINTTWGSGQKMSIPYAGQPFFVSEYGGIWWNPDPSIAAGWGYGQRVASEEEFQQRFEGLTRALLEDGNMFGYCYTQLTDVFQEQNGIYRFDRSHKLDVERVHGVQQQRAAIEQDFAAAQI